MFNIRVRVVLISMFSALVPAGATVAPVRVAPPSAPSSTSHGVGTAYTVSDFTGGVDDFLYQIDLNTGALTQIGVIGFANVEVLSFGPGGVLYGMDDDNPNNYLITINLNTGAGSIVGPSFNLSDGGIAFDSAGNLWGTSGNDNGLFSIEPATGAATFIGATQDIQGLTASGTTLYGIDDDNNALCSMNLPSPTCTVIGALSFDPDGSGLDFDCAGNLFYIENNTDALFSLDPATGIPVLIAGGISDFESLAIACPSGPSADFKGSTQTDGGGCYDINGFRGCVFHDQGEHFASGGNHYREQSVLISSEGYEVCIALPTGYMATGTHINQSTFIEHAYCYTDKQGARVDFGIEHIELDAEQLASANAELPDAETLAAAAVVGHAIGAAGGEFSCSDALIIVPPAIVADGTRFLCASSKGGSRTSAAPPGLSVIAPRVDLTTEPERKSFDQSLTICLPFSVNDVLKAGGRDANLVVGFFDGSFWQSLPQTPSPAPSLICGLTDHLSMFGLLARVPHALPATGSNAGTSIWLTIALGFVLPVLAGILTRRRNTSAR